MLGFYKCYDCPFNKLTGALHKQKKYIITVLILMLSTQKPSSENILSKSHSKSGSQHIYVKLKVSHLKKMNTTSNLVNIDNSSKMASLLAECLVIAWKQLLMVMKMKKVLKENSYFSCFWNIHSQIT